MARAQGARAQIAIAYGFVDGLDAINNGTRAVSSWHLTGTGGHVMQTIKADIVIIGSGVGGSAPPRPAARGDRQQCGGTRYWYQV